MCPSSGTTAGLCKNASAAASSSETRAPWPAASHSASSTSRRANADRCSVRPVGAASASKTVVPVGGYRRAAAERAVDSVETQAEARCAPAPLRCEILRRTSPVLRPPRVERGDLGGVATVRSVQFHCRLDLSAAARERTDHPRGNPADLSRPLRHRCPLEAERLRELLAEVRLVQEPRRARVLVDEAPVECRPLAVRGSDGVRDDDVSVELRIACAAHAVHERGGDQARHPARRTSRQRRAARTPSIARSSRTLPLRRAHARIATAPWISASASAEEDADALRGREGDVEAGDRAVTP